MSFNNTFYLVLETLQLSAVSSNSCVPEIMYKKYVLRTSLQKLFEVLIKH